MARALRPGEGTSHPSAGRRDAWGDHTKPLPILWSKEGGREESKGRGHPHHPYTLGRPGTLQAPPSPVCQLSPGDRNGGLLARAHGDPTLQVVELA